MHLLSIRAVSSDGSFSTVDRVVAVNDVDEFNLSPVVDSDALSNAVAEDAATGSLVGLTASSQDADDTDIVTFSLTDDAGGLFQIDSTTGVVTVRNPLDHESASSHGITVRGASTDGSAVTSDFTISVTDVNEQSVSAIVDTDASDDIVAENSLFGSTVGVAVNAVDPDGTDSVSYSLTENAGSRFAINSTTGVITILGFVNHETADSHLVTVRADSTDGSFTTRDITIAVSDVNEFGIGFVSDADSAADSVDENSNPGTTVGVTATATDTDGTDTVSYSLTDNAGNRFAIDSNTGEIKVAGNLDHEAATSHQVTVRAESTDGSTSHRTFFIGVADVDETDVGAITEADSTADSVIEDAAIGAAVGITAQATDTDLSDIVSYSLTENAGNRFAIDSTTGVITVSGALDHEAAISHLVTVRADSSDGSFTTRDFTLLVGDVNESGITAISDTDVSSDTVDENAAIGAVVGVAAQATDADLSDYVSYSLTENADNRFTIDPTTGVITVAGALDHETATSHLVTVRADSSDGSFTTRDFTLLVGDVNESGVTAVGDTDAAADAVDEDAAIGTAVGVRAQATDADLSDSVSYSLTENAGNRFTIDSTTGVITVAGALDHEAATSHLVTVRADSSDGSFTTRDFTINVADVNESSITAISDSDVSSDTVDEDATIGAVVGVTTLATDTDSSDTVSYSLTENAGNRFSIDSTTGVITVAGALDHETATSHLITVRADSSDGSFTARNFTIAVDDVNDSGVTAIGDTNASSDAVDEDATPGAAVGVTAQATDSDSSDAVSYSLTDNAGNRFTVDPTTGVITVAGALDHETATSHLVTVRADSSDGSFTTRDFTIAVGDVDESGVTAISDTDSDDDSIDEDAAIGTAVGVTAQATDADLSDSVSYSLTENAGNRFTIDSTTGVITVAGALDHEAATSHLVTVRADSSDGSFTTRDFTIAVDDINESGVGAVTDADPGTDSIDEDAAIGAVVGVTAQATDTDTSDSVSYSLTDNAGNRFAIDSITGVITVAGALDHESTTSHVVTVRADSSDGSSTTRDITIAVGDVNESGITAIIDTDTSPNTIDENAVPGSAVGVTAMATDSDGTDSVTYSLLDNADDRFAIDSDSGVVTVSGVLDHETDNSHLIQIEALSSDGSRSLMNVEIVLIDSNKFPVGQIIDVDSAVDAVNENSAIGSSVGITVAAEDADTTDNVRYSLENDAGGRFLIDEQTGEVTIAQSLDHEDAERYSVIVRATSDDDSTTLQSFDIEVVDVNEAPTLEIAALEVDVQIGTQQPVIIAATDPDMGDQVRFAIVSGNEAAYFEIDATTGQLTTQDDVPVGVYELSIELTDSSGETSQQTLQIRLFDDASETNSPDVSEPESTPNVQPPIPGAAVEDVIEPRAPTIEYTAPDFASARPTLIYASVALGSNGTEGPIEESPPLSDTGAEDYAALDGASDQANGEEDPNDPVNILAEGALRNVFAEVEPSDTGTENQEPRQHSDSRTQLRADRAVLQLLLDRYEENSASLTAAIDELFEDGEQGLTLSTPMVEALRAMKEQLADQLNDEQELQQVVRLVSVTAGVAVSAGFVLWLLKSGLLVAGTVSTAKMWTSFDPIPVAGQRNTSLPPEKSHRSSLG